MRFIKIIHMLICIKKTPTFLKLFTKTVFLVSEGVGTEGDIKGAFCSSYNKTDCSFGPKSRWILILRVLSLYNITFVKYISILINKPGTRIRLRKGLQIPMDGLLDCRTDGLTNWKTDQRTEGGFNSLNPFNIFKWIPCFTM